MGRIGHSLIMLGQLPHCSLFSVCWADDGLRVPVRVLARVCVCIHEHEFFKMRQGYGLEKGPYLISSSNPPASSLCLSKLDFILQKQSGMNNSFSSPSFCFFFSIRSFSLPLVFTFVFRSSFSCALFLHFFSPFTSWYSEHVLLSVQCGCVWSVAVVISLSDWIFPHVSWNTLLW